MFKLFPSLVKGIAAKFPCNCRNQRSAGADQPIFCEKPLGFKFRHFCARNPFCLSFDLTGVPLLNSANDNHCRRTPTEIKNVKVAETHLAAANREDTWAAEDAVI